jgi:hypothetical protein
MRSMGIAKLVLVAAFALSVVASSATASPVFYTKVEVGATASTPVKFTRTFGPGFIEGQVSRTKTECFAGTLSGEVSGATTTKNIVATFTGCKTGTGECHSAGEPEHTIKTLALAGELGDVKAGVPGLRLFNEATGRGGELAPFTCFGGAIGVKVRGSVIGQLTGATGSTVSEGKFTASHQLKFAETAGLQKFALFLGESTSEQLESKVGEGSYENSGVVGVATLEAEGVSNLGFTT